MAGSPFFHLSHHVVGLLYPALADEPGRGLGQLDPQDDGDDGEQGADPVHPPPTRGEALAHNEGQTERLGLGRRRQDQPSQMPANTPRADIVKITEV